MFEAPVTRYATAPDGTNIAYQVVGEGDVDLVFVPGWISNLDLFWEMPASRRFFSRLASFARLVVYDKRGTGLSDPIDDAATIEVRAGDLGVVMDAAGVERAAVCGYSEGAGTATFFAASNPDRVTKLVLATAYVGAQGSPAFAAEMREVVANHWGEGAAIEYFLPNHADDPRALAGWARSQRQSCTRGMALKYWDLMSQIDTRGVLGSIAAPTLVLARVDDPVILIEGQRELAAQIPDAKLVELEGNDHLLWLGDWERVCDEIEAFVVDEPRARDHDRVLSTVLFTDIVGSTERAGELGDRRWRELLTEHDRICAAQLERHGGRLVKTMGDGVLATFDGPARGIRSACAIRDAVKDVGLEVRAGLHTGECELMGDDIGGVAVHIAARVSAKATAGEVLVSRTVKDLIAGSGVELADRGTHALKG
ncbi:MAG: adenylate/guanylate cyclase domain-containing protein, partial [Actinomycetota bacterium]|nr:adenylate/guanylate cyclase domain-containing protein [Actinomycetota bacterium]